MSLEVSDEQAAQLLNSNHISQETHDAIVNANAQNASVPPPLAAPSLPQEMPVAAAPVPQEMVPPPVAAAPVPSLPQEMPVAAAPSYQTPAPPVALINNINTNKSNAAASTANSLSIADRGQALNNQEAQLNIDKANEKATNLETGSVVQGQYAKDLATKQADTQKALEDNDKNQKMLENIYATSKVDPNRFVANMPLWKKGAFVILGALAGLDGQGTGRNGVVNTLDGFINADIESQKGQIAKVKDQIQLASARHGLILSDAAAWTAAKSQAASAGVDAIRANMESHLSKFDGPTAAIMRDRANTALDEIKAHALAIGRSAMDSANAARAAAAAAADDKLYHRHEDALGHQEKQEERDIAAGKDAATKSQTQATYVDPDGKMITGNATTPEAAKLVNEATTKYQELSNLKDDYLSLRQRVGQIGLSWAERADARAKFDQTRARMIEISLERGGAEGKDSETQKKILESQIPDWGYISSNPDRDNGTVANWWKSQQRTYNSTVYNNTRTGSKGVTAASIDPGAAQTNASVGFQATPSE